MKMKENIKFPLNNMANWQKIEKCKTPIEYHGQLLLRPQLCPLRTYWNSPLCPTGHRPFGGRCPALPPPLQLITPSRASGTADHVQTLDDLLYFCTMVTYVHSLKPKTPIQFTEISVIRNHWFNQPSEASQAWNHPSYGWNQPLQT